MGKKKRRKAKAGNHGKPVAAQPAALPERSSLMPPASATTTCLTAPQRRA